MQLGSEADRVRVGTRMGTDSEMKVSETLEDRIVRTVAEFEQDQMALHPTSVSVNLQSSTLFVMLEGITFPAEKACAREEPNQELLEQYHARAFDVSKRVLETEIEGILGRSVERSTLSVDPVSGNGVIQFALGSAARQRDHTLKG